ncbi:MAG: hypothetical protein WBD83_01215 [Xanthobacteraceae bacterium]
MQAAHPLPHIDTQPCKQILRFSAEKFPADLMMLTRRFFENDDWPTLPRKLDCKGRTSETSADNNSCQFGHQSIRYSVAMVRVSIKQSRLVMNRACSTYWARARGSGTTQSGPLFHSRERLGSLPVRQISAARSRVTKILAM